MTTRRVSRLLRAHPASPGVGRAVYLYGRRFLPPFLFTTYLVWGGAYETGSDVVTHAAVENIQRVQILDRVRSVEVWKA